MNYKVLYRKYRPTDFESIVGQKYIVKTLKNSIINENISHAYIFSGPRGTGKTSTAKIFSKAINCQNPNNGSPCGNCEFCTNFLENPDIIEIDAASNNGVDEIRNLIDNIKLAPTNGKYKVYIIDEVHMLTASAFNALLLTLEEPPAHTVFILATTNIESVPITILSRCQRFDFQKLSLEELKQGLTKVCQSEDIEIEEAALEEIAYLSEGGMRDALSILDKLSKDKVKITLDIVENQIKTISQKKINDLLDTLENNDAEKFLEIIADIRIQAVDYKNLLKKTIDGLSKKSKNLKLYGQRQRLNYEQYKNLIFDLADCLTKININVDPYTIIEMIFLNYFSDNVANNSKVPINKEEEAGVKIENKIIENEKNDEPHSELVTTEFVNVRINNCFTNAQKMYLENLRLKFKDDLSTINVSGKVRSILLDSMPVAASDKYVIIACSNEHMAENANKLLGEIEKTLKELLPASDYKAIFISNDLWLNEKNQYIKNLKEGKTYRYIEEQPEDVKGNDIEINDVFNIDKVEII